MAKISNSIVLSNASIFPDEDLILEYKKDETLSHSIKDLLANWAGKEGLTISIKQDLQVGNTGTPSGDS